MDWALDIGYKLKAKSLRHEAIWFSSFISCASTVNVSLVGLIILSPQALTALGENDHEAATLYTVRASNERAVKTTSTEH